MKHIFIVFLAFSIVSCGDRPAPEVSLIQALRCEKIAILSEVYPFFVEPISVEDALTIQIRAQNAALARAESDGLGVYDVSKERYLINFGIYSAPTLAFAERSKEEKAQIEAKRHISAISKAPKLSKEFNDICAPLFM